MRRIIRSSLLALGLTMIGTTASVAKSGFDSGNDVYLQCTTPGRDYQLMCLSKSVAYVDMMLTLGYSCARSDGVTGQQVRDILVKYMTDYPAIRNQSAATLAVIAFSNALACKPPPTR